MKRVFLALSFALLSFAAGTALAEDEVTPIVAPPATTTQLRPTELQMQRATASPTSTLDLRNLPQTPPPQKFRAEREEPDVVPVELPGGGPILATPSIAGRSAPAPLTSKNFAGLDFATFGAGHPPDTNGDVGPTYFIQSVNSSIGIYDKTTGTRVAGFSFNTFMSQGSFGNQCDSNNFGDPVVLYDSFEDRWVITDFAFTLDGSGNVNPPVSFQCFAVSKTGDPVTGGWNFYSMAVTDALNDYSKFAIWPDGIYMSANMFAFPAGGAFQNVRTWAFNKAQMYAGAPTIQIVSFNAPPAEFTLLPANARLQAGTPPLGAPNYFNTVWQFTNALSVYKFHVDWNSISLSSFTGPFTSIAPASWISPPSTVPTQAGNANDTLAIRLMMQNQYANIAGAESIWATHTVRNSTTAAVSAVRYYQTAVTGGTVAATTTQAANHEPDTINRYMPSLAVNRLGDMAIGYSASTAALFPAIRYAGRLATDPVNTLPQTETSLIEGTGSQTGTCGATCTRWGDYSTMTLDPNGCTFWYTNEYYATSGLNWQTRIGAFAFPTCTPLLNNGTLQGTVTATPGGAPISGATVRLGSRTAITNGIGVYSFAAVPSGTYPGMTGSSPGYNSASASNIVIVDASTTTQDFSLSTAAASACFVDTTQADFQLGVPTLVDLTTSPGDVTLLNVTAIDQQNTAGTTTGTGPASITNWQGQTFIPAVTGTLVKADVNLFCSGCTGTTPNLTLSVRATSGGLPTGADLASATITGFSSGAGVYYTATFGAPATLTSGTQYALLLRPVANPSVGAGYFWIRSSPSTYANGQRVLSTDSGATFTADSTRDFNFKAYMQTGFAASGNQVSSLKDSNPATGFTPTWSTLSWTAATPANTALTYQVAASNSGSGPFNFVGPDGTAGTFFTTSGASLSQFNGQRYLQYKALLSTTNSAATPTVNDVTMCFADVALIAPVITLNPTNAPEPAGAIATYTAAATGSPTPTVQWQRSSDGSTFTNVAGATATTLTITTATTPNIYQYRAVFTNSQGVATTTATRLPRRR